MKYTKIAVNSERCTGCRNCVFVCSYHHQRNFDRCVSSVQVKRNEREGEFEVKIYKENENGHLACDLCANEEQPLCSRFCPTKAILAMVAR